MTVSSVRNLIFTNNPPSLLSADPCVTTVAPTRVNQSNLNPEQHLFNVLHWGDLRQSEAISTRAIFDAESGWTLWG
jgi:hypothetical protein